MKINFRIKSIFCILFAPAVLHAATLQPDYIVGNLAPTFTDDAERGYGDSDQSTTGDLGFVVQLDGLWQAGQRIEITGVALPLRTDTDAGTFTFNFYDLDQGAQTNAYDGNTTETLVGTAEATLPDPAEASAYWVVFDTPIVFTAQSTGIAVQFTNSSPNLKVKVVPASVSPNHVLLDTATGTPVGGTNPNMRFTLAGSTIGPIPGTVTLAAGINQATNLPAAKLVAAANHPEGRPMSITGVNGTSSMGGTVSLNGGQITYMPATSYTGADQFSYTVSDDLGGSAQGTVQVAVVTEPGSYNRLSSPDFIATNAAAMDFLGLTGYSYALDRAANLSEPVPWMPVTTNLVGTSGWIAFTNSLAGSEGYFRTRRVPASSLSAETRINGDFWFDMNGNKVDATEMSIIKVGSYYYAFGNKRLLPSPYYDEKFKEFRCYRSTNLRDWEFRATALKAADLGLGDTWSSRCKVIHNPTTGKYVMWFKLKNGTIGRVMGVAVANSVEGPYTFVGIRNATSGETGDMSLFQEGTHAYTIASDVATRDFVIDKLTDDYLDIASHVYTIPAYLEAPQLFKVGNRYFCTGSGVTGWNPNQSKYSSSTSLTGGWSSWANFGNNTTYDAQGSDVFVINGTEAATAILCADRWEPAYLGNTTAVWLPITISGSTASISYLDSFYINVGTGVWSPGPPHYYKIINKYSGKALAVINVDAAGNPLDRSLNGADIVQWTYDDNQDWCKWQVAGTTDGHKKIINKHSSRAMEVFSVALDGSSPFAATDNGADICQFDYYDNNDTFKWKCQELDNGNGYRSIINKYSGKAAAVFANAPDGAALSRTADGADVGQYDYHASQEWYQWEFILLPDE